MFYLKNTLLSVRMIGIAVAFMPLSSLAAGFQLGEQSVVGLGRAFAGGGVVGDDVSAVSYNPAGMTLGKGLQMQAAWIGVHVESKLQGSYTNYVYPMLNADGKTELKDIIGIPSFFTTYQFNDKWTAGLGVFPSYGFDLEYEQDWFGAMHAVESNLTAITVNPSVAYKINDKWSIGFGLTAERMTARLTAKMSKMKADDWAFGYNFGIMYEPVKNTRFGLSYRSKVRHKIEGDAYSPTPGAIFPVKTEIDLPAYALLSGYRKLNDRLGLSASLRWTHWSVFKDLDIKRSDLEKTISYVPENWKDTWYVGLGADFYVTDKLTARVGWAYDSNPIKGAEYRTARIPDTYRYIVSLGLSYKWNEHFTIDAGYMHVFFDNANIDNYGVLATDRTTKFDRLTAVYKSSMNLFGAQLQYQF